MPKISPPVMQKIVMQGSLNATLARGKIVLCFQTRGQRVASVAADTVRKALGVGVIFAQFMTKDIASSYDIPCIQVDLETGSTILNYIGDTRKPVVKFSSEKTILGKLIAPEVAYFSSRGSSSLSPSLLKPDIAAPGVNILAAWPPASMLSPTSRSVNFRIDWGTSMSCPHISAVVALLKLIHPDWSPAAIKSALVTTANAHDEYGLSIVAEGAPYKQADAFDHGGGHVDPNKALDPGLVYDTGVSDYIRFLCSMGYNNSAISSMTQHNTACKSSHQSQKDLNLPSISIPELRKTLTVSRTVTNVGPVNAVYRARIEAPKRVDVNVEPKVLLFNMTAKKLSFKVTFRPKLDVRGRYMFGCLSWEDGVHSVRIPLVVRTVIDDFYTVA
ncbi:subtilisin-like protease SBT3.2 [Ananas comosus]|uniref:Subtilisin-like protease SBT3.2 n=1 Tax=Ananas comosus TaxID=4615 RepID=A0A6P5H1P8_ANACO|nr:subtilisin-like protease SBT3.2 [Ananas comosus]